MYSKKIACGVILVVDKQAQEDLVSSTNVHNAPTSTVTTDVLLLRRAKSGSSIRLRSLVQKIYHYLLACGSGVQFPLRFVV